MHKPKGFYLWLIGVSMLLPVLEFIVFSIVYGTFIEYAAKISAYYLPIGIISAAFLLYLMMSTRNRKAKKYIFRGYILSLIVNITISVLLRGLPYWFVANIVGGLIILGGTFIAYLTKPKSSPFYI